MVPLQVSSYLDSLKSFLHLDPSTEGQILRELDSHLQERVSDLVSEGHSVPEAARIATESLGGAKALARRMQEVHARVGWEEVAISALPHLILALLFAFHQWSNPSFVTALAVLVVAVTLFGWWQGKRPWLYTWVGYALTPLMLAGYFALPLVGQATSYFFLHSGSLPPTWGLIAVAVYFPLAIWLLVSTTVQVVRKDWILASLMLLPLPALVAWLFMVDGGDGLLHKNFAALHGPDPKMAALFLAMALTTVSFLRLQRRALKVGALILVTMVSLTMASYNSEQGIDLMRFIGRSLLIILLFLSPALLEAHIGDGNSK